MISAKSKVAPSPVKTSSFKDDPPSGHYSSDIDDDIDDNVGTCLSHCSIVVNQTVDYVSKKDYNKQSIIFPSEKGRKKKPPGRPGRKSEEELKSKNIMNSATTKGFIAAKFKLNVTRTKSNVAPPPV